MDLSGLPQLRTLEFDWILNSCTEYDDPDDPISRIIELLQTITSSHFEQVNARIMGYMPPLRTNIAWDLLQTLITKPEWNADLPRMTLCVQWMNDYSDPDRLSKHHVKDLQGRLSTLTESNHVSITGSNWMADDSESQQGSEEEEDGADI
jgi:hypothetical protein